MKEKKKKLLKLILPKINVFIAVRCILTTRKKFSIRYESAVKFSMNFKKRKKKKFEDEEKKV